MRIAQQPQKHARRSLPLNVLLTLFLPGVGHWRQGDRRRAALFLAPVLTLVGATLLLVLFGGTTQLLILLVTPGALVLLGVLNLLLAAWRISALAHLVRGARMPRRDRVIV